MVALARAGSTVNNPDPDRVWHLSAPLASAQCTHTRPNIVTTMSYDRTPMV